jgi:NAD+ synthase (glutamine-hydrolysing)
VADAQVISDARRIVGEPEGSNYLPLDPEEFSFRIFHTCYMGTENSGVETRKRARMLADAIGRYALQSSCLARLSDLRTQAITSL